MYKLVVLRRTGFEILTFLNDQNCKHWYATLLDSRGKANPVVTVYMYGPADDLITYYAGRR